MPTRPPSTIRRSRFRTASSAVLLCTSFSPWGTLRGEGRRHRGVLIGARQRCSRLHVEGGQHFRGKAFELFQDHRLWHPYGQAHHNTLQARIPFFEPLEVLNNLLWRPTEHSA